MEWEERIESCPEMMIEWMNPKKDNIIRDSYGITALLRLILKRWQRGSARGTAQALRMQGLMLSGPMALVGSREDRDSYTSASLSSREEIVLLDWIGVRGPVLLLLL